MKGLAQKDSKAVVSACFAVDGMILFWVFTFSAVARSFVSVVRSCFLFRNFDYCLPMLDIDRWLLCREMAILFCWQFVLLFVLPAFWSRSANLYGAEHFGE